MFRNIFSIFDKNHEVPGQFNRKGAGVPVRFAPLLSSLVVHTQASIPHGHSGTGIKHTPLLWAVRAFRRPVKAIALPASLTALANCACSHLPAVQREVPEGLRGGGLLKLRMRNSRGHTEVYNATHPGESRPVRFSNQNPKRSYCFTKSLKSGGRGGVTRPGA